MPVERCRMLAARRHHFGEDLVSLSGGQEPFVTRFRNKVTLISERKKKLPEKHTSQGGKGR
jgi:hypothetical protein